jgi:hypothetical protein
MVEATAIYDVGGKTDLFALCNVDCKDNTRCVNRARQNVLPSVARKSLETKVALQLRLNLRSLCV